jgi:hypothetical protein
MQRVIFILLRFIPKGGYALRFGKGFDFKKLNNSLEGKFLGVIQVSKVNLSM